MGEAANPGIVPVMMKSEEGKVRWEDSEGKRE